MRRLIKRIIAGLLGTTLLISNISVIGLPNEIPVSAEGDFATELSTFLGREVQDYEIYNWSLAISSFKTDGLSNNAICGILGNMRAESGDSIYAIEGYYGGKKTLEGKTYAEFMEGETYDYGAEEPFWYNGTRGTMGGAGHGIVQWTYREEDIKNFVESHDFGYVTVTHWIKHYDTQKNKHTCKIPNIAGQMCFMLQEISEQPKLRDKLNNASSPYEAARIFCDDYERPAHRNYADRGNFAESAISLVDSCEAVVGKGKKQGSGSEQSGLIAVTMLECHLWDEDQFVDFCRICEPSIDFIKREHLDLYQALEVDSWQKNVETLGELRMHNNIRAGIMFTGYILIVYVTLLYIGYLFDRVNNFLDISVVYILSFGKLALSPDDKDSTYARSGGVKAITHTDMLKIVLIGIGVGVLIVSGKIFDIVNFIINLIT